MANIINKSFFILDCFIAQLGQLAVQEKVDAYISRYEPRFLAQLLGVQFYLDFQQALNGPLPIDQRWLDLRNGKTYTDAEGKTHVWPGFGNDATKISAIACYVFYWYTRSDASFSTGSGEVVPTVENGVRDTFVAKQVQAWGEMVKLNYDCLHYLQTNKALYPEWGGLPGWYQNDWVYFLVWWGTWRWAPVLNYWWPACPRPDIFIPLNHFGL